MKQPIRQCLAACLLGIAGFAGLAGSVQAAPAYSGLVIFGDSLSDTGNVLSLTTAFAPPPFPNSPAAPGRFSNGPVWTEHLAAGLGLPGDALPSNLLFTGTAVIPIGAQGGQNYAYGGARTGLGGSAGPTTGLFGQLVNWNGSPFGAALTRAADPNALYVVLAGANDLRDFRSSGAGPTPTAIAFNVSNAVGLLAQAGARNFLVSNLPDLGKTPEAMALGLVPQSTAATLQFNAALSASMGLLDAFFLSSYGVDLDIRALDFYGLFEDLVDDAVNQGGATYGITNVLVPCIAPVIPGVYFAQGSVDVNCGVSAFSDPLHPSAVAHRLIGQSALALLAVPEPGTLALIAIALVGVGCSRRRLAA